MNKTIFKQTLKQNYKLILIFIFILCFYQSAIIYFINPEDMSEISGIFNLADGFLGPLGIDVTQFTSPLNYTASTFFSVLVMAFSMVFYIILSTGLIAKPVENSSITSTLSSPIKRSHLVFTKAIFLIFSLFVLYLSVFISGTLALNSYGDFEVLKYLNLVFTTYLLSSFMAMLSYFISICFCTSRLGINLATAVPIGFLFLDILSGVGEDLSFLKKITPFGYFDSIQIITNEINSIYLIFAFSLAIFLLIFLSVKIFDKKNLPI